MMAGKTSEGFVIFISCLVLLQYFDDYVAAVSLTVYQIKKRKSVRITEKYSNGICVYILFNLLSEFDNNHP